MTALSLALAGIGVFVVALGLMIAAVSPWLTTAMIRPLRARTSSMLPRIFSLLPPRGLTNSGLAA